jgi:hypothetical protein
MEDVNGYPITHTAIHLTGTTFEEYKNLTKENDDRRRRIASRLWNEMQKNLPNGENVHRGVVKLVDQPHHAQVWLKKLSNTTGTFSNPHAEQYTQPRGKIFNDDLSKILSAVFYGNPNPTYDRYVNRTVDPTWRQRDLTLGTLAKISNVLDEQTKKNLEDL